MDKTRYVDVFHGSGTINLPVPQGAAASWHAIKGLCGNTSPGAVLPFGKYAVAPYSGGYSSGYGVNRMNCGGPIRTFSDTLRLRGFSHFQQSGTGATHVYYNYAVVRPSYGGPERDWGVRDESGRPGRYAVTLAETGIRCELTAARTCAMHRYAFGRPGGMLTFDFENDGLYADEDRLRSPARDVTVRRVSDRELAAAATLQGVRLWFSVAVEGDGALDESGAFRLAGPGTVTVRLSASAESAEAARRELEASTASFDEVAEAADAAWEDALGRVCVEGGGETERRLFYSNLYHSLVKPCDWGGGGFLWRGAPFVVDIVTMWDLYKTQLPLLYTLFGEVSSHLAATITRMGLERGRLPHSLMLSSELDREAAQACALGEISLYDAWVRGVEADWPAAVDAALKDVGRPDFAGRAADGSIRRLTHVLDVYEGCSAAAELARAVGKPREAETLARAAGDWREAFDPATGLLRADSDYYEGNHWNYSFRLLRGMEERIALAGGREAFVRLLDKFFGFTAPEDLSGRFEGFNNETDMEAPWAYHAAGRFDRLCEVLDLGDRYAFRTAAGTTGPGGIPGNNDSGGLSACEVWNDLGLFPVSGQDRMLCGRPKFCRAALKLASGETLTVERTGEGKVPARVTWNGKTLRGRRLAASEMMRGGALTFIY